MKKLFSILLCALMIASLAIVASGAADGNGYIKCMIEDAELIDDDTTQDQGGSGNPIQIVDGYGCGYSSKNDIVAYNDVDFGANGAQAMDLLFGYGNNDGSVTTLSFMLDDPSSAPIATAEIGFTGGWEIANAGWVRVPMTIPAGVHTVYVQFTSEKSGSISDIVFEEAPEAPAAAADTSASPDTATTAPATFDAGVLAALAAIVSAAGFALSKKH